MSHYNKSDSKQTQEVASAYFIPLAIRFAIYKIHVIDEIGLIQHQIRSKYGIELFAKLSIHQFDLCHCR